MIRTGHLNDADAYEKYQGHEYQKTFMDAVTEGHEKGILEQLDETALVK